jgi:2-C-methyl-D-erythritol 4-phosphate cytidylyltransferase
MTQQVGVVVVAAGSSTRMAGVDKVFADLRGRPLIAWSLSTFESCDEVTGVVLVLSEPGVAHWLESSA